MQNVSFKIELGFKKVKKWKQIRKQGINFQPLSATFILTRLKVNNNLVPGYIDSLSIPGIFPPGDTMTVNVSDYVFSTQNHNQGGASIMVIWPAGAGL